MPKVFKNKNNNNLKVFKNKNRNNNRALLQEKSNRRISLKKNQELSKKFVNYLMVGGKKNLAYKIFSAAIYQFAQRILIRKKSRIPLKNSRRNFGGDSSNEWSTLLLTTIKKVQPTLEGRKRRVGASTKIIPAIVSEKRGCALAIRWIIKSAERRKSASKMPFFRCLAEELLDAHYKKGRARQQRDESHKICQSNRGNLRYRWW